MTTITYADRRKLTSANFDTTALLRTVDALDDLRAGLSNDSDGYPPLRADLLRLHPLAIGVFNGRARGDAGELSDPAAEIEMQVDVLMASLEQVQVTRSTLTALRPESLPDAGWVPARRLQSSFFPWRTLPQ